MKNLLIFAVLAGIGWMIYAKTTAGPAKPPGPSVHIGASVEEVEKVLGPPISVLPNFGNELRSYKTQSGRKYMLIFKDGELVEIQ